MRKIFYAIHHRTEQIDYDWLVLCLSSLSKHSDAEIIIVSDNISLEEKTFLTSQFNVIVKDIPSSLWNTRRMLCKLEQLNLIFQNLEAETYFIMSDTDMLFLKNPFKAFSDIEFDIGITTRIYKFYTPINAGMVFFRVGENVKRYSWWVVNQIKNPDWWPYIEKKSSRDNVDWNCDQDMLHAIYTNAGMLEKMLGISLKDVGCEYNYFAGSDVLGDDEAVMLMKYAYETKRYPVLHFKGQRLKKLIYEMDFGDLLQCQR